MTEYIPAGYPSAAEGYEDEPLNLHDWLVVHPAATFFYRVEGDELQIENIRHGSLLVVDRSLNPLRRSLVVAEHLGGFIVCRVAQLPVTDVEIVGVVIAAVTRY